jgi:hypothetical protein
MKPPSILHASIHKHANSLLWCQKRSFLFNLAKEVPVQPCYATSTHLKATRLLEEWHEADRADEKGWLCGSHAHPSETKNSREKTAKIKPPIIISHQQGMGGARGWTGASQDTLAPFTLPSPFPSAGISPMHVPAFSSLFVVKPNMIKNKVRSQIEDTRLGLCIRFFWKYAAPCSCAAAGASPPDEAQNHIPIDSNTTAALLPLPSCQS